MPESKKKALGILAIAGVEPYQAKPGEEYMSPEQTEHFTKNFSSLAQPAQGRS